MDLPGRLLLAALLLPVATTAFACNEMRRIDDSIEVLRQVQAIPEQGIPQLVLRGAQGIMIIPHTMKIGFLSRARHGSGFLVLRDDKGEWIDPVFVRLAGGSLGWQIGSEPTDLILVFKSKASVAAILKGELTIGAEVRVAAGPVGLSAEGATRAMLNSDIYSYSRNRGVFAGIPMDGGVLSIDQDANGLFYSNRNIEVGNIIAGESGKRTATVTDLLQLLKEVSSPSTEAAATAEP